MTTPSVLRHGLSSEKDLGIFPSSRVYIVGRAQNFSKSQKSSEFLQVPEHIIMTTRTRPAASRGGARNLFKSLGLYSGKSSKFFQVPEALGMFVILTVYTLSHIFIHISHIFDLQFKTLRKGRGLPCPQFLNSSDRGGHKGTNDTQKIQGNRH